MDLPLPSLFMRYYSLFSLIYARREGDSKPPPLTAYCFMPLTIINDGAAAPVQDVAAPVRDAVAPVQDAVASVQDAVASVQDAVAPVQDVAAPVRDAVAQAQDDAAPEEAARDDEDVVPVRMPAACTCTRLL